MTARPYTAFGLEIRSDFELPFLEESAAPEAGADLHILREATVPRPDYWPVDPYFDIRPDRQYLFWRLVGAFLIDSDRRILVAPHEGVPDRLVAQPLLGLVISLLLERRQLLCLHAGAVSVGGRAAVFMGDKGAGKSTTTAAMLEAGHLPITDDLVAVDIDAGDSPAITVRPGFGSVKLWPDSIAALRLEPRGGDRPVHASIEKVQKQIPAAIPRGRVPMGAVFVLDRSGTDALPRAERLAVHDALQAVLRHTFMERYGETRLGQAHLVDHMRRCSQIAARIPVYRLHVPPDLAALGRLCAEITRVTAETPA